MKRLTYIYWGVPAACALSLLRGYVSGTAHVSLFWVSLLPALVLWGATWLRLQENRAMRPEFSALAVLPHLVFFGAMAAGEDLLSQVQANIWMIVYTLMWLGSALGMVMALCPSADEKKAKAAKGGRDAVFIMMSILTLAYCWYNWTYTTRDIFLKLYTT